MYASILSADDLGTQVDHRFDGFDLECVQSGLDSFVAHFLSPAGNIDSQLAAVERFHRSLIAVKAADNGFYRRRCCYPRCA